MRIRSIKPEFWRSDDIAALPISARLLFVGLWSYVDDNGVGSDKLSSIAADLFAEDLSVDPAETLRRVGEDSTRLEKQGLIVRYEAGGKRLLYVTNWERHQVVKNPSKGHCYPLPPGDLIKASQALRRPSGDPTETLGTGTGEQGNRGTEEQGNSSSAIADATPRPDVEALLDLLDSEIEANGGRKPKRTKKNEDAIRLMLDRDKIPAEDIAGAIRWCQADEFWRSNILSASKLREKYDTLRAQARRKKSQQAPMSKAAQNAARYREEFGDGGAGSLPALDAGFGV